MIAALLLACGAAMVAQILAEVKRQDRWDADDLASARWLEDVTR